MKRYHLLYVLTVLCNSVAYSQNVLEQIKEFYLKSDLDCYIDLYQRECATLYRGDSKQFKENCWFSKFNKENMIFILNIQFANTETYNFDDDICNYLVVDSARTFSIAFVDNKMNVLGISGLHNNPFLRNTKQKLNKEYQKAIKDINKEKPELILHFPNILVRGYTPCLYYIKDGKIYVFFTRNRDLLGKSQELNEYIRSDFSYFNLNYIRQLDRITDLQSQDIRFGGHTPIEQMRVCSPLIGK